MKKKKNELRVEKHNITVINPYFSKIQGFCHLSKNLYNHANYKIRQKFIKEGKWLRYADINKELCHAEDNKDYTSMPTAKSAQQTLRVLDSNWKSFFEAIKDWKEHKEKYLGRPKIPKYKEKNGYFELVLTNQECKLRDGIIHFPKVFDGFTIRPCFVESPNFVTLQQVRFIPRTKYRIVIELVYKVKEQKVKESNERYIGIDLGVNNLATVSNNVGLPAYIINGKPIKSINQYYNKSISHYKSVEKQMNNKTKYTKRMLRITAKRTAKITDYLHKASRKIVNFCVENEINTIVIGYNKEWKQDVEMGSRVNQNFVQIPFARFIDMLRYKAKDNGIVVRVTEESYTSGTSFIDNEEPTKVNYDRSRRIHRGLFRSNDGKLINADLNGAYQIMKKVVPMKWDRGCALHPLVVDIL